MYTRILFTIIVSIFSINGTSFAADCSNYPYSRGMNVSAVEGSEIPKIISTSITSPSSVDVDDVNDAYDEAEIAANARIAAYLKKLVSSEKIINEEVNKITKTQGQNRETQSQRIKKILKSLSSKASQVLTGVMVIGDCYTPGKEVRVTVGIKPETIANATGLSIGMSKSIETRNITSQSNKESTSNNSSGDASKPSNLRPTEGFSNTEKLKKF